MVHYLIRITLPLIFQSILSHSSLPQCGGGIFSKCRCQEGLLDCSHLNLRDWNYLAKKSDFDQSAPISHVTDANFSHNNFSRLTKSLMTSFYRLEFVDFSYNSIGHIDDNNFVFNSKLKTLNLAVNDLTELRSNMFSDLDGTLKHLNVSYNLLTTIRKNTFSYLPGLKTLDLSNNSLEFLEVGAFGFLSFLTTLILDDCKLESISSKVFTDLLRLETLSLKQNKLISIPVSRNNFYLRNLYLDGNNFENVARHAFVSTSNIFEISLNNMKHLKSISKCAFCGLPKLDRLTISRNTFLTKIASFNFGTTRISKLDLSWNNLTTLPADLIHWNNFVNVSLTGNAWNCDCHFQWITRIRDRITDEPRCLTPQELFNRTLKSLSKVDFNQFQCANVRIRRSFSTPKLFISLLFIFFIASSVLLGWYCLWKRRKSLGDPVEAAKQKREKKSQPYAYRNLVMMQDDSERPSTERLGSIIRQRENDDHDDILMNPAILTLEKTSVA